MLSMIIKVIASELKKSLRQRAATQLGMEVHAGHGLNYKTAQIMAQIEQI